MSHTGGCSGATGSTCSCDCVHALHGSSSGNFSAKQVARAREPAYAAVAAEIPDLVRPGASATSQETLRRHLRKSVRVEVDRILASGSSALASGLINEDMVAAIVTASVSALRTEGRLSKAKAGRALRFHVLCTLFAEMYGAVTETNEAIQQSLDQLLDEAIRIPAEFDHASAAILRGIKSAVASDLASKATEALIAVAGYPDPEVLRSLAVAFCPDSRRHAEIQALEAGLAADIAAQAVTSVVRQEPALRASP